MGRLSPVVKPGPQNASAQTPTPPPAATASDLLRAQNRPGPGGEYIRTNPRQSGSNPMIRQAAPLAAVAALAASAAAQHYRVEVTPSRTAYLGPFTLFAPGSGTLVGDFDPIANPTGTRTKPGDSGPFGPEDNIPVPASPWLVHTGDIDSLILGGFDFEVDAFFELVRVTGMDLDLLQRGDLDLDMDATGSYETFRTRSPEGLFPAGSIAGTPIPEGRFTSLTFTQTAMAEGSYGPTGPTTGGFDVIVPGVINGTLDIAGSPVGLPMVPATLALSGEVTQFDDSIRIHATAILGGDARGAGGQAWSAPIELPVPDGGGSVAGLLASATIDRITAAFELSFGDFAAQSVNPCPADCNGDGTLDIFDFLCFQGVFASGSLEADCDADGELTVFDFLCYLDAFEAGCP